METRRAFCWTCGELNEDYIIQLLNFIIRWGEKYPEELPEFSLSAFYNEHVAPQVSSAILAAANEEAEVNLGMQMTYTVLEALKEKLDELTEAQPEAEVIKEEVVKEEVPRPEEAKKPVAKKEQLTKAQKRRMWEKGGVDLEERPRGWDWIDIVRHLSQTGSKDS